MAGRASPGLQVGSLNVIIAAIANRCSKPAPGRQQEDTLVPCGPGVERLEEEVESLFPTARRLVVTSDTLGNWRDVQAALESVERGEVDIIIGTQIICWAPSLLHLTLVIGVDADLGLKAVMCERASAHSNFYSRSVVVQGVPSWQEVCFFRHTVPTIFYSRFRHYDRDAFVEREINMREQHHWPPFARLASLIISGKDLARVDRAAKDIRKNIATN